MILEDIDFELLVQELEDVEAVDGPLNEFHLRSIISRQYSDLDRWDVARIAFHLSEILFDLGITIFFGSSYSSSSCSSTCKEECEDEEYDFNEPIIPVSEAMPNRIVCIFLIPQARGPPFKGYDLSNLKKR